MKRISSCYQSSHTLDEGGLAGTMCRAWKALGSDERHIVTDAGW